MAASPIVGHLSARNGTIKPLLAESGTLVELYPLKLFLLSKSTLIRERQMQLHKADGGLSAVLQFAQLGFQLVPVHGLQSGACTCRRGSACPNKGKHPKQREWQKKGSSDHEKILRWWKPPFPNVGVVTGSVSRIVVVDVDGEVGLRTLEDLEKEDESIRNTRIHRSGSGGLHLFYQYPDFEVGNSVKLRPGIDVRSDAGLIVLPPSRHVSGGQYETVDDREIAALPVVFRQLLTQCYKERQGVTRKDKELPGETRQVGECVTQQHEAPVSLWPSIQNSRQLNWAVKYSLPDRQGIRNKQVFRLVQNLFTIPGLTKETPLLQFRPIVDTWYQMAEVKAKQLGFTIQGDIEETWSDFVYGWERVKHAVGGELASVFDLIEEMDSAGEVKPQVWDVLIHTHRTEQPEMRLLIGVLYHLAQLNIDESLSLACPAGAEQFRRLGFDRIDPMWVYRRLHTLTDEGVVFCVDRGKPGTKGVGQAAKYTWIWKMSGSPV